MTAGDFLMFYDYQKLVQEYKFKLIGEKKCKKMLLILANQNFDKDKFLSIYKDLSQDEIEFIDRAIHDKDKVGKNKTLLKMITHLESVKDNEGDYFE